MGCLKLKYWSETEIPIHRDYPVLDLVKNGFKKELTYNKSDLKGCSDYLYSFGGMERDDEVKGGGNSYTTEFRQYDSRLGRWLSLDPMASAFPWQSPYAAFDNNPISIIDPAGLAGEDTQKDKPKKLSGNQLEALLDPKADPKEKFETIRGIQDGSYELNNSDIKEIIKTSESNFIKNNKEMLEKINDVTIDDGKLTINLNSDVSSIGLVTGQAVDLIIGDEATVDFSELKITDKVVQGIDLTTDEEEIRKVLIVSGNITFSKFTANIFGPVNPQLKSIEYKTYRGNYTNDKGIKYQNLYTESVTKTALKNITNKIMYQWVPYQKTK